MLDETIKSIRATLLLIGLLSLFTLLAISDKKSELDWIYSYESQYLKLLLFSKQDATVFIPNNSDESQYETTLEETENLARVSLLAHINHSLPNYATNILCGVDDSIEKIVPVPLIELKNWSVTVDPNECEMSLDQSSFKRNPVGDHKTKYELLDRSYETFGEPSYIDYEVKYNGMDRADLLPFCQGYLVDEIEECDTYSVSGFENDYDYLETFHARWRLYHHIKQNNFASIQLLISDGSGWSKSYSFNNLLSIPPHYHDDEYIFTTGSFGLEEYEDTDVVTETRILDRLKRDITAYHGPAFEHDKIWDEGFHRRYQAKLRQDYEKKMLTLPGVGLKVKAVYLEIGVYILLFGLMLWLHQLHKQVYRLDSLDPNVPWSLRSVYYWGEKGLLNSNIADVLFESIIVLTHIVIILLPIIVVLNGALINQQESIMLITAPYIPSIVKFGIYGFIILSVLVNLTLFGELVLRLYRSGKFKRLRDAKRVTT